MERRGIPRRDNWNFNASNPLVYVGGNYGQNSNHGLFYVNYNTVSATNPNYGFRVLSQPVRQPIPGTRAGCRAPLGGDLP